MNNKLKNEMEKIKMPKDTKERIIAACENAQKRTTGTEEYTDHVYNAEHVNSRKRIIHSISAVAACAVIVSGIAGAGILFNKRGGDSQLTQVPTEATTEEVTTEEITTEAAEPTTELTQNPEVERVVLCETSPFADILDKQYIAAPFTLDYVESTQEQRDRVAELFNSQTWYEFDGIGSYYDWVLIPNRNNFTIVYSNDNTVSYISATYDDCVCLYSETFDESGNVTGNTWKFYTCYDMDFGEKLADIYDIDVPDAIANDEDKLGFPELNGQIIPPNSDIIEFLNTNDNVLFMWSENNVWDKEALSTEQIEVLKKYFEEHELTEIVANTIGQCGGEEWNKVFGTVEIQLYDWQADDLTALYISKDNQFIAVYRPSYDEMARATLENVKIYRAEDLEELDFIHDYGI